MNIDKKNLIFLYKSQIKLDETILKKNNLKEKDIFEKKILAFLIELSELINEQKEFKYWCTKKILNKKKILEEYIDGLHFLISIGNSLNFNLNNFYENYKIKKNKNIYLIKLYLKCFEKYINFIKNKNENNYFNILNIYFEIAKKLNFTEKEIISSYKEKNKINFERQKNNY